MINFIFTYIKYAFHTAIFILNYLILQRFFLANGENLTTIENVVRILLWLLLIFMSLWSHYVASGKGGLDPGYVK